MDTDQTTWQAARQIQQFPGLTKDIETDVVIIGGGLAGILSAYVLAKAGKKVVLVEKARLAEGTTTYTTAFLTQIIDTDAEDVCRMLGIRNARLVYASHMSAIALIERIQREEAIDCDFRRITSYIVAEDEGEAEDLEDERDVHKALGITSVMVRDEKGLGVKNTAVVEVKDQAKFHPIKFISGLVPKLVSLGVEIYENTEAVKLESEEKGGVTLMANHYSVKAKWSITATYSPFDNPPGLFMKKGMYVSYVCELEVPKGKYVEGTYENMKNPYHYFRVDPGETSDTIIIGGEDHRKEVPMDKEKNWQALKEYSDKVFGKDGYKIVRRWDGGVLEPSDGFALIGIIRKNQIVATAFSGNGMTYSGITALMAKDIIEKGKSDWDVLYRPKRFPSFTMLRIKARDYIGEFFRGAVSNMMKYKRQPK